MRDTSQKLLYPREYVTRIQLDSRQDWRTIRIGSQALVDLAESLEVRSAANSSSARNSRHVKRQRIESAEFPSGILRNCNRDRRTELEELFSMTLGN